MGDNLEKSGIHLTGKDSGWPVGGKDEPPHTKDGSGKDPFPHASEALPGGVKDAGKDEVQKLTVKGEGGTIKWTFDGKQTAALKYDATAAELKAAFEALDNVAPGDITISGGPGDASGSKPYTATFGGQYVDTNVPQITADTTSLTGTGKAVTIETTQAGTPL